jgi:HEAT repeat protein
MIALTCLVCLPLAALPDVATLRKLAQSPEAAKRLEVVQLLLVEALVGELKVDKELLGDLVPLLDDPAEDVRKATLSLWGELGVKGLPPLLEQMESRDATRRRIAAKSVPLIHKKLGETDGRKAIQQLERLLFDPDAGTRAAAEGSLRALKALP